MVIIPLLNGLLLQSKATPLKLKSILLVSVVFEDAVIVPKSEFADIA